MSMRRSRLQVKPNIGASKAGARGNKADDKTTRTGNKVTNRESLKSPEKTVGKSSPQLLNESLHQNFQRVEKGSLGAIPTAAQTQNQKASISRTPICSLSSTVQSPIHQPEQDSKTCSNEELTKIHSKVDIVEDNTDVRTIGDALTKSPPTEGTEVRDNSDKTNSNPTGRLRSRFSRKIKPNLSEAGKSRNRKSTSSVEIAPKPAALLAATASIQEPVSLPEAKVDEIPAAVVDSRLPSTLDTSQTGIPDLLRVNDTPEVAAEVMVAAEVDCPAEEVDIYQGKGPSRSLSPSSIADSSISQSTDCSTFPNLPESVRKPVRRRTKVLAPLDKPPDKCKMLMKDLIYWNPISNPMKVREKKSAESEKSLESVLETGPAKAPPEEPPDPEEEEDSLPVPQVKIGPDGSIILNEESLVIDRKSDNSELDDIGVLDETDAVSTYASFRARHLSKNWSDRETERFYYALSVVGTDFSMMCNLFKRRNRYDLKKKFKREEKNNRPKVDKALRERKKFDMSFFENVTDEEDEIEAENKKKKKEKGPGRGRGRGKKKQDIEETQEKNKPGKKRPSKKKRKGSQYFCEDSEEEEEEDLTQITSDTAVPEATGQKETLLELEADDGKRTVAKTDNGNSSDEDEMDIMNSMCQTTRSGRVPKRTALYNIGTGSPRKRSKKETSVNSQSTEPLEDGDAEEGSISQLAVPDGGTGAEGLSVTAASTNQTSTEIHTVQNIPSVGGSQIVLVTQKGQDSSGQGTVIHVYMLSPTGSRTPEWSGRSSPRVNPHVYTTSPRPHGSAWPGGNSPRFPSASPRPPTSPRPHGSDWPGGNSPRFPSASPRPPNSPRSHGSDWPVGNSPRFPSASPRPPVPEWPSGDSPKTPVYSAVLKLPVSVPSVEHDHEDSATPTMILEHTPASNADELFSSTSVNNIDGEQITDSTNTECTPVLNSENTVLEEAVCEIVAEENLT